jgi:hypothetical protein
METEKEDVRLATIGCVVLMTCLLHCTGANDKFAKRFVKKSNPST